MELSEKLKRHIFEHQLFEKDQSILLALSGGIDSTVLFHLLIEAGYAFAVAHCNFNLRDKESDEDEQFVKNLCEKHNITSFFKSFETSNLAERKNISIQMAARELRYHWLGEVRQANGFDFIATAHHKDDVAETIILNFIKGTGIRGLHGIASKTSFIVRPLLIATKEEITLYAKENAISWREDSSNQTIKYQRNLVRHEIIKLMKSINPNLIDTLYESARDFYFTEQFLKDQIEGLKAKYLSYEKDHWEIPLELLNSLGYGKAFFLYEILSEFNFNKTQIKQVIETLRNQPGSKFYSNTHILEKGRDKLYIYETTEKLQPIEINQFNTQANFQNFIFHFDIIEVKNFEKKPQDFTNENVAYLDAENIKLPLKLRHWYEGDKFYPLGMNHSKKLSDFFVDEKLSGREKESVIIVETEGKIIWIAGYRIDNRFRLHENSKNSLRIEMEQNDL